MDCLFDKDKPHFSAWNLIFDVQDYCNCSSDLPHPVLLYYAALFSFHDLAEHLLDAHLQDLNSQGGHHGDSLNAALHGKYPDIVLFLLECGANVESWGCECQTASYKASSHGYTKVVQSLIHHGADLNTECGD